jgi:hypothetical protein
MAPATTSTLDALTTYSVGWVLDPARARQGVTERVAARHRATTLALGLAVTAVWALDAVQLLS